MGSPATASTSASASFASAPGGGGRGGQQTQIGQRQQASSDDGPLRAILSDRVGSIIVSAVLGLGLAVVFFWRVCRGDSCVVVRSGEEERQQQQQRRQDRLYRVQGDACYRYVPYDVPCSPSSSKAKAKNE